MHEGRQPSGHSTCGKRRAPHAPSRSPPAKQARPSSASSPHPAIAPLELGGHVPTTPPGLLQPEPACSAAGSPRLGPAPDQQPAPSPFATAVAPAGAAGQVSPGPKQEQQPPQSALSRASPKSAGAARSPERRQTLIQGQEPSHATPADEDKTSTASQEPRPEPSVCRTSHLGTTVREATTQALDRLQQLLSLPQDPANAAMAGSHTGQDVAGEAARLGCNTGST